MAPHYKTRDERAAAVAAGLPADREAVASLALATADRYDAAILNCDAAAFEGAADTFEAIIYHLNGGSLFGSMTEGGGAYQLRDILSPADGTAAGWGRPSRFAVELDDVRAVIRYTPGFLSFAPHFELYAVDVDRPSFPRRAISRTSTPPTFRRCRLMASHGRCCAGSMLAARCSLPRFRA